MGAEAFEVKFGENKSIAIGVSFSKGDAIQVPVSINSLDAEKIADRIADQLQLPEIDTTELAKQGDNTEATNSKILEEVQNKLTPLEAVLTELNNGKQKMVDALATKNVQSSTDKTLSAIASDIRSIVQSPITIDGGEMYEKQLFGSLEAPNFWNLYDVMANLLSDGRLTTYGGILLAEYSINYDSIMLEGAGAGGAYVVSDVENGTFKMYTEDIEYIWDTNFDVKGNRWVAYCFANAAHDFHLADSNNSIRSIHIGRHVGNIVSMTNGRVSEIVVTDGNMLESFRSAGKFTQNFGKNVVLKTVGTITECSPIFYDNNTIETLYLSCESIVNVTLSERSNFLNFAIIKAEYMDSQTGFKHLITNSSNLRAMVVECPYIVNGVMPCGIQCGTKELYLKVEDAAFRIAGGGNQIAYIYITYFTNDKTKSVVFKRYGTVQNPPTDLEIQKEWCKPLNISEVTDLTEENMINHILKRLKQDEDMCGSGVTITLGATNLAKLTSEEAVALLDSLTNTYGYTFA